MDVGGGRGELLARCMLYAGHESRGVLFDRQWVLDRSVVSLLRISSILLMTLSQIHYI